jgi:hypothetical protein
MACCADQIRRTSSPGFRSPWPVSVTSDSISSPVRLRTRTRLLAPLNKKAVDNAVHVVVAHFPRTASAPIPHRVMNSGRTKIVDLASPSPMRKPSRNRTRMAGLLGFHRAAVPSLAVTLPDQRLLSPTKPATKAVFGLVVELLRRADLLELALVHDRDVSDITRLRTGRG